jgi:Ca2+/H+ antiporter, TMEM165/GDT1 family
MKTTSSQQTTTQKLPSTPTRPRNPTQYAFTFRSPCRSLTHLQVPTDLPPTPYSDPLSNPSTPIDSIDPSEPLHATPKIDHSPAVISPIHSLVLSFTMILFSEIGDKTFLVAALMAMRHDRILVFTAAYSALITMTVLSAVLGHAVPSLISPHITNFLAAGLFLVFGVRMLLEARKIAPDEGVSEEMKEVEMELEEKEQMAARRARRRSSISPYVLESGRAPRHKAPGRSLPSPPSSPSSRGSRSPSPSRSSSLHNALDGLTNLFSLLLSPAWVQTFVMTFLGEWGDRSQIATIAMAAGQDYWWVTAGALGGHAICTGVAVLGGKAIAGRVSLRTVTMGGAIAFLVFGFVYLAEAMW